MTVHFSDDTVTLHHGDCLDVIRTLPESSVDSVVTDPPYGLGFMGREWDSLPPGKEWAEECLRVLKPGGHLVAFGGSRTWHRLAVAVEDAGFEIRDSIAWLYGSGFPKSLDVAKAIESHQTTGQSNSRSLRATEQSGDGADYTLIGKNNGIMGERREYARKGYSPGTSEAQAWDGWGTALKPAFEPIVVGRKPLAGTVATNVIAHGTGALNIDACRIEGRDRTEYGLATSTRTHGASYGAPSESADFDSTKGRWPTNALLDASQAPELDEQSGVSISRASAGRQTSSVSTAALGDFKGRPDLVVGHTDSGGASRFFPTFHYEPKAPTSERPNVAGVQHPTVKPLDLMRWLVRLVTPPNGTVLEPFAGSGTTAEACVHEHMKCIAVERESDYLPLIISRLTKPIEVGFDFGGDAA